MGLMKNTNQSKLDWKLFLFLHAQKIFNGSPPWNFQAVRPPGPGVPSHFRTKFQEYFPLQTKNILTFQNNNISQFNIYH